MTEPLHPLCLRMLMAEEGCVLQAYDDEQNDPVTGKPAPLSTRLLRWTGRDWRRPDGATPIGFPTIGYGRRIWPGEEAALQFCTKEQAGQWLEARVEGTDLPENVDKYWHGLNPFQRGALAIRSYNCGTHSFVADGILPEKLAAIGLEAFGHLWRTTRVTTRGVYAAFLAARRAREWALFTRPWDPAVENHNAILAEVMATQIDLIETLPSLSGVILSEDEDPH